MAEKVEIIIEAEDNASDKIEDITDAFDTLSSTAMKENFLDLKKSLTSTFEAISGAVGDVIKIAGEDELIMVRLDAQLSALGDTANVTEKDIVTLADQLSKLSGFDDEALIEGQTTLLRFGTLSKEQFEQATKAAADLAAMTGMDLVSAFRQVGIALDNPEQGFGRLKRQIGDLTTEQQAAIDKMIEMGDTAGAQGLILDALSGKVDGAANAFGETFIGKVGKAQTAVDNFKSSVGNLMIQDLPQWLVNVGVGAGAASNSLMPLISSLSDLAIISMAIQKGGGFSALIKTLGAIPIVAAGATAALVALAFALTVGLLNAFGKFAADLGKKLGDALGIKLPAELDRLRNVLIQHGPFSKEAWVQLGVVIESGWNTIKAKLTAKIAQWKSIGISWVNGLRDGIRSAWSSLTSNLNSWIDSMIAGIKAKLGISSPSKVFAEAIGKPMAQGVQMGFGKQLGTSTKAVSGSLTPGTIGGGSAPTIVINYAPTISTGSRAEFEAQFVPLVDQAIRRVNRGKV